MPCVKKNIADAWVKKPTRQSEIPMWVEYETIPRGRTIWL